MNHRAEWPLVGREAELERMALAREDGDCHGVVVSAPAGVGKSRLAREAHVAAARDGALVDWVQATSSAATVPLGAFAGLIPDDACSDNTLELMRQSAEPVGRHWVARVPPGWREMTSTATSMASATKHA